MTSIKKKKIKEIKNRNNFYDNLWGSILLGIVILSIIYGLGYSNGSKSSDLINSVEIQNNLNNYNNEIKDSYQKGYTDATNEKRFENNGSYFSSAESFKSINNTP